MLLQLFDRSERCAVQRLALKDGKPSLDPIEPRRPRRGEMEVDVWMFLEPAIALLMGVEIIEDDVQLAMREGGNHAVHEAEELDTAPPLGMLGNNPEPCARSNAWIEGLLIDTENNRLGRRVDIEP